MILTDHASVQHNIENMALIKAKLRHPDYPSGSIKSHAGMGNRGLENRFHAEANSEYISRDSLPRRTYELLVNGLYGVLPSEKPAATETLTRAPQPAYGPRVAPPSRRVSRRDKFPTL